MKIKKLNIKRIIKNIIILILLILLLIFAGIPLYKKIFKAQVTYNIVNGYVEKTSNSKAYIVKKETVLDVDKTSTTVPVVEQYKRTSKGEIIAIYKNKKYDEYLKQIESMDKEIQILIKDLPVTYSTEIGNIDAEIAKVSKEIKNINSYVKMQEFKSKMDDLAYKKTLTLGEISPPGSKIKELIDQRKKIEEDSKKSSDSIKSNASGAVTYKLDNLENIINIDNILKYSVEDIEGFMNKYNQNIVNNYGIKIVDNYEAYIIIKEPTGENDQYIKEGKEYTLKMIDKENKSIVGKLIKNIKNENNNYCIFKIDNGIESIIDARILNIEVTWVKVTGEAVLLDGIKKDSAGYDYITIITKGKYVKIPITIKIASDSICIIENMSIEKRKELNITDTDTFNLYDQVIIQE